MPTPTREQLDALVAQWRRDADGYPVDQPGALHAATAVRLCADELAACLAAPPLAAPPALVALLKDIEWSGAVHPEYGECCPHCGNERQDGHHPVCKLAAVLSAYPLPAAPPVPDTPQGMEADDDPAAWFPSPDLRCITCGHLRSVHLAKRGRCLSLNAVEGGSVPCACAAFVVDMVDALRVAAPKE